MIESMSAENPSRLAQFLLETIQADQQDMDALSATLHMVREMDETVTDELLTLLGDGRAETRMMAATLLGELEDRQAMPGLIELLKDRDPNVRFSAIEALGRLKAVEAVEPLTAFLHQKDFFLTFPAIQALGEIGESSSQTILLDYLSDDIYSREAVVALGRLGQLSAIPPILDWLSGENGELITAVIALDAILSRRLRRTDANNRPAGNEIEIHDVAILVSERLSSYGMPRLLNALPDEKKPESIPDDSKKVEPDYFSSLAGIFGWLSNVGDIEAGFPEAELLDGIGQLLQKPSARERAAGVLVSLGDRSIPLLATNLSSKDEAIRYTIMRVLDQIESPACIPLLVSLLDAEQSELVTHAAETLGRIGHKEAFEDLFVHIGHNAKSARRALSKAVVAIEHPDLYKRLPELLNAADPLLREAGIRCLIELKIGQSGASKITVAHVSNILSALADQEAIVRQAAIEALPYFSAPQIPAALAKSIQDADPAVRRATAQVLASYDPQVALPLLERAAKDTHTWTRLEACRSLAKHGGSESRSILHAMVADTSPPVRICLAEVLGEIGHIESIPFLLRLSSDEIEEVTIKAREAIEWIEGRGGGPSANQATAGLSDESTHGY
jgi:HEAT repeat protein